jgi:hypothetical protein
MTRTTRVNQTLGSPLVANARGYQQLRTGNPAAARSSFEAALTLPERAGRPFGRPFSLWGLGHIALAEGDPARARRLHHDTARAAQQRSDQDALARSLEGLAATYTTEATARLGARLLGAATVRRGHMHAPRPVIGHDEAATTERALRRLLDGATFETEGHAGSQLHDDQLDNLIAAATQQGSGLTAALRPSRINRPVGSSYERCIHAPRAANAAGGYGWSWWRDSGH